MSRSICTVQDLPTTISANPAMSLKLSKFRFSLRLFMLVFSLAGVIGGLMLPKLTRRWGASQTISRLAPVGWQFSTHSELARFEGQMREYDRASWRDWLLSPATSVLFDGRVGKFNSGDLKPLRDVDDLAICYVSDSSDVERMLTEAKFLPNLRSLSLTRCKLSVDSISAICSLTPHSLAISECEVAQDFWREIPSLSSVRSLSLSLADMDVNVDELSCLREAKNLQELKLQSLPSSVESLSWISEMPGIRLLVLSDCMLRKDVLLQLLNSPSTLEEIEIVNCWGIMSTDLSRLRKVRKGLVLEGNLLPQEEWPSSQ